MKKTIFCCDRCGEQITDIVYTLTCYGEPVQGARLPLDDLMIMQAANARQNRAVIADVGRHLCRKCKDELTDGIFIV